MRWSHPTRGLLLPDAFLPLAEETGLIVPIGQFTYADACRQLGLWHELERVGPVALSVNLSARQLADPGLVEMLGQALAAAGVDPRYLILEITETTLIQDMVATSRKLEALRALGRAPGARRLRHRLLVAQLPAALSRRHAQGRPLFCGRTS